MKRKKGSKRSSKNLLIASALVCSIALSMVSSPQKASANAVNDYVKQGVSQKGWKAPKEQDRTGQIRHKYSYNKGRPEMVINHETANNSSNIEGEISYMIRNQNSAFVHEFVDANNIIGIADTNYLSWGAGPRGNGRGIQVEQVRMHNKDDFAKQLLNLATFNSMMCKQYGWTPTVGQPNGSGSIWTHSMVTQYLGGTDHMDPNQYWAERARSYFGTTYTINDFQQLVSDVYYGRMAPSAPAKVTAANKITQSGGNWIIDVNVAGETSRIEYVDVAVWGEKDGQNDLKWYRANKVNAGTYRVVVDTNNHREVGHYLMHTYVKTNDGRYQGLATNRVPFREPVFPTTTKVSFNGNQMKVTAKIDGSDQGRISSVEFPVWTQSNQSDLKWYKANKVSRDTYEYTVNLANHPSAQKYNVHTYVTGDGWNRKGTAVGLFEKRDPVISGVTNTKVNGNKAIVTTTFSGDVNDITEVHHPTWSSTNNQKDMYWYKAKKVNANTWQSEIDLTKHNIYGNYITHTYVQMNFGPNKSINQSTFNWSEPKVDGKTSIQIVGNKMKLRSEFTGDINSITKVQIPVWADDVNRTDIVWYEPKNMGNGVYETTVDLGKHGFDGPYNVHTYVSLNNTDLKIKDFTKVDYQAITAKTDYTIDGSKLILNTHLDGDVSKLKELRVPVWADPDQKDIVWYVPNKLSDKEYQTIVDLDKHGINGKYNVHTYVSIGQGLKIRDYFTFDYDENNQNSQTSEVKQVSSKQVDTLSYVDSSKGDKKMYKNNPPITNSNSAELGQTQSRDNQTFRTLRETTLSNGETYAYGLFGDKEYAWIDKNALKDSIQTPTLKESLPSFSSYDSVKPDAKDIRSDVVMRYSDKIKTADDVKNNNSSESLNVQVKGKRTYSNGEVWHEIYQNGKSLGWIQDKELSKGSQKGGQE